MLSSASMLSSPSRTRRPMAAPWLLVVCALATGLLAGCAGTSGDAQPSDAMPSTAASGDWQVLFDGTDLRHWKGYNRADLPAGWRIEDGTLHFSPGTEGGDIITRETYGDFELELEWKVAPCGNSGIFYRGVESEGRIYDTAPEMQVLDDSCHADARFPSHRAGANYDLYMATPGVVRAGGEWNETRIVANGRHVEHWLNGQKVVEYEQGSEAWQARLAASKFRTVPSYGRYLSGVIGLQDHGDPVWYRNIRIRRLG